MIDLNHYRGVLLSAQVSEVIIKEFCDLIAEVEIQQLVDKDIMHRLQKTNKAYKNHLNRYRCRNRLLAEVIADERAFRVMAYDYYQKRLQSKLFSIIDTMTYLFQKKKKVL